MRAPIVAAGLCTAIVLAPIFTGAQSCIVPRDGVTSPEAVCVASGTAAVSASEPLTLGLTGLALLAAGRIRRLR
jgi:hypothetical protein